ncbi:TIGR00725 family protein [Archaeoglobales archaeon]|nr:MAG: TIGR00725 family protein [Archaeoglobales archaeon]
MLTRQIGVIGASYCDDELYSIAYNVGKLIAKKGWILINGGLGGVMEASARGAKENGGLVVGVLPGGKQNANPYINIKIATNMYHARNMIIVYSSDALIAIGGGGPVHLT